MNLPQITPERWIRNLVQAAELIASCEPKEIPDKAINLLNDSVLDGFIEHFSESFSPSQVEAANAFRDEVDRYCRATSQHLEPANALADLALDGVRNKALDFVRAFKGNWPNSPA